MANLERDLASDPDNIQKVINLARLHAMAFAWTAFFLIAGGLAIGALGSGLTLRRYLRV